MHPLGVISCVGQRRVDFRAEVRIAHHLLDVQVIGSRPATRRGREDQVCAAVGHEADLRKTPVGHAFQGLFATRAPSDEVVTDMMRLESAAIHGGQLGSVSPNARPPRSAQRLIEDAIRGVFFSRRSAAF